MDWCVWQNFVSLALDMGQLEFTVKVSETSKMKMRYGPWMKATRWDVICESQYIVGNLYNFGATYIIINVCGPH